MEREEAATGAMAGREAETGLEIRKLRKKIPIGSSNRNQCSHPRRGTPGALCSCKLASPPGRPACSILSLPSCRNGGRSTVRLEATGAAGAMEGTAGETEETEAVAATEEASRSSLPIGRCKALRTSKCSLASRP